MVTKEMFINHERDDDARFTSMDRRLEGMEESFKLLFAEIRNNTEETKAIKDSIKELVDIWNSFGTVKKVFISLVAVIAGIAAIITSLKVIFPN